MSEPINVTPSSIPTPATDSGHKLLIVLSHASILIGVPFLLPIIVYLVTKNDDTPVAAHAAESFNFHLSFALWALFCVPLTALFGIGALLLVALGIASLILAIMAP
ncbi:MAG: DUF4870 domain-containing protein [Candidatus Synoicihabitans palmerolidicus]|nr:DUF4870 domain-containing protein [Candidatus Synoicihabitans palmerolidicus]